MKQNNIKILFLLSVLLSVVVFASTAKADGDSLYISPAVATVNVGTPISSSVAIATSGDKICAAQGTIVFNNLTCQDITLANGVMAQTQPSCSSPTFVIGIPKCTTTNTVLFTISSKAVSAGTASISFSGVNLVGVGASAGTTSTGSTYIVNVSAPAPKTTTKSTIPVKTDNLTITTQIEKTTTELAASNQPAALTKTPAAYSFFGWMWENIVWIIVIIIVAVISFITGKKTCRKQT